MVRVRPMSVEDARAVAAVEERAFADAPDMATFWEGDYRRHVARYPEGQLVAEDPATGAVVGAAVSLRIAADVALARHTWWEATGGTGFAAHDPEGDVLYGADLFVDPAWQGRGVAAALYDARDQLLDASGCIAFATGARMPGYGAKAREGMLPQVYVRLVEAGKLHDPVLGLQLKRGMTPLDVLPRYLADEASAHRACLVAKANPRVEGAAETLARARML